jgi:rubrerythrin
MADERPPGLVRLREGQDDATQAPASEHGTRTRGRLLRQALLAGGGALAGAGVTAVARAPAAAPARRRDRRVLSFLLQLEYLQAAFYSAAADRGRLRGELREFAEVVGAHERDHVERLERLAGRAARQPRFDFGRALDNPDTFARTARRLEETGVAAYVGQGANVSSRVVSVIAQITAVEARHAAWISDFVGRNPAPRAADKPLTSNQVLDAIRRTGFFR